MKQLASAALGLVMCTPLLAQDWPAWRGPAGNGVVPDQPVPLTWDRETGVKWRVPLAQPGNGSPIVSRGRVFLTMAEDEEGKQRSLYCFDREDGAQLWVRTVDFGRVMPTHETNPHCSTTPAANGERVVVWHASAGLFCYDFAGEELWKRDLGEFRHMWGHGTSPVLHDGKVILNSGPGARSFVGAYDLATGKTLWETDEPSRLSAEQVEAKRLEASWCTPLIQRVGERDLVLCGQPTRVVAYDAANGAIVWWSEGVSANRGDLTYSSPIIAGNQCVVVGGYVGPTLGVRLDGEGDVTETHRTWLNPEQMSNCSSGVFAKGYVFVVDMNSMVHCIAPESGETIWRERVGRGSTWGSILSIADRLYMMSQSGTTYVFEANGRELVLLAENELEEKTNATPAVSNGELFLRTHESLYCIAQPAGERSAR